VRGLAVARHDVVLGGLAVVLAVLGILGPGSGDRPGDVAAGSCGPADRTPGGHVALVAQIPQAGVVARPGQPAPGGLLAVLPAGPTLPTIWRPSCAPDTHCAESGGAAHSTCPARAPPVLAA
jgi:hypothetical protein